MDSKVWLQKMGSFVGLVGAELATKLEESLIVFLMVRVSCNVGWDHSQDAELQTTTRINWSDSLWTFPSYHPDPTQPPHETALSWINPLVITVSIVYSDWLQFFCVSSGGLSHHSYLIHSTEDARGWIFSLQTDTLPLYPIKQVTWVLKVIREHWLYSCQQPCWDVVSEEAHSGLNPLAQLSNISETFLPSIHVPGGCQHMPCSRNSRWLFSFFASPLISYTTLVLRL